jgi:hypothetical protein
MSLAKIEQLIKNLGQNHSELIATGLISNHQLIELFPGADDLYLEPEPGLYMRFLATSKRYKSLSVTLTKVVPVDIVYEGELPPPYAKNMLQADVQTLLGEPNAASGPINLPEPMGKTGGWEAYHLDSEKYPNIKAIFQYSESMQVDALVFRLIDENAEL